MCVRVYIYIYMRQSFADLLSTFLVALKHVNPRSPSYMAKDISPSKTPKFMLDSALLSSVLTAAHK